MLAWIAARMGFSVTTLALLGGAALLAVVTISVLAWRLDVVGDERDRARREVETQAAHIEAQRAALDGWRLAAEANASAREAAEERARGVRGTVARETAAGRPEAAAEAAAAFLEGER